MLAMSFLTISLWFALLILASSLALRAPHTKHHTPPVHTRQEKIDLDLYTLGAYPGAMPVNAPEDRINVILDQEHRDMCDELAELLTHPIHGKPNRSKVIRHALDVLAEQMGIKKSTSQKKRG